MEPSPFDCGGGIEVGGAESGDNTEDGEEEREEAEVDTPFDIIFNAPVGSCSTVGVELVVVVSGEWGPLAGKGITVAVIGGVTEEVGEDEGKGTAGGEAPATDLGQRGGAFAEVNGGDFIEGDELDGAEHEAEEDKG